MDLQNNIAFEPQKLVRERRMMLNMKNTLKTKSSTAVNGARSKGQDLIWEILKLVTELMGIDDTAMEIHTIIIFLLFLNCSMLSCVYRL